MLESLFANPSKLNPGKKLSGAAVSSNLPPDSTLTCWNVNRVDLLISICIEWECHRLYYSDNIHLHKHHSHPWFVQLQENSCPQFDVVCTFQWKEKCKYHAQMIQIFHQHIYSSSKSVSLPASHQRRYMYSTWLQVHVSNCFAPVLVQ